MGILVYSLFSFFLNMVVVLAIVAVAIKASPVVWDV